MGIYLNHPPNRMPTPVRKHLWLVELGGRPIERTPEHINELSDLDVLVLVIRNRNFDAAYVCATQADLERAIDEQQIHERPIMPFILARAVAVQYVEPRHVPDVERPSRR